MSRDPNLSSNRRDRNGGLHGPAQTAEFGTVISSQPDRYTHSVRTSRGKTLHGVPRKRMSPSDLTVLPAGASVIIRYDLPLPYIDGCLDLPAVASQSPGTPLGAGNAGAGFNASTALNVGGYRGPHEPSDLQPGDHVLGNNSGVRVGALEGGVAILHASQYAQIRAHLLDDFVEVFSRNYRHITDMGIFKIKNDAGRVTMSFRGASDQRNEAATDEENWTIKMDLGAEGDLFNFQLTTPLGQDLFKMHVDSNGRCEIFGLDGVILQSGARNGQPHVDEHGGDHTELTRGDATREIQGNYVSTIQGSEAGSINGTKTESIGVDYAVQAVRDVGISSGRNFRIAAAGDLLGNPALSIESRGGDYVTQVGTPTFPTPKFTVTTFQGDMVFTSTLGGNINFKSLLGTQRSDVSKFVVNTLSLDSVVLGGTNIISHVAKYEQLEQLVRMLIQLLVTHVHPHPTAPTGVSTTPFSALANMLLPIKSTKVGVGG